MRKNDTVNIYDFMKPKIYTNAVIGENVTLPYRIYVPDSYSPEKKYGLMIFMHGSGERGNNNLQLHEIGANRYFYYIAEDEKLKDEFILLAPQCADGYSWVESDWEKSVYDFDPETQLSVPLKLFYDFVDNDLCVNYNIDSDRILMTGISMGGYATWFTMMFRPDLLAAAIPVCGGADPKMAEVMKDIPTWVFHSEDDPEVPSISLNAMSEAMQKAGATDFHSTLYKHEGHFSWTRAYSEKPAFDWFISRRKDERGKNLEYFRFD